MGERRPWTSPLAPAGPDPIKLELQKNNSRRQMSRQQGEKNESAPLVIPDFPGVAHEGGSCSPKTYEVRKIWRVVRNSMVYSLIMHSF